MVSVKEITMTQAELKEILDYNPHNGEFYYNTAK